MSDEPIIDLIITVTVPGEPWYFAALLEWERPRGPATKVLARMTASGAGGLIARYDTAHEVTLTRSGDETIISVRTLPDHAHAWRAVLQKIDLLARRARELRRGMQPTADDAIERYYRARAQGSRITLRQLAEETGFSYSYLRTVKAAYDAHGGWGSKSKNLQGRAGTKSIE